MKTCVTCKHYNKYSEKCLNEKLSDQDPVKGGYYYYFASTNRISSGWCGLHGKYHETKVDEPKVDELWVDEPKVKPNEIIFLSGPSWTWTEVIVTAILIGIVVFSLYQIKYL